MAYHEAPKEQVITNNNNTPLHSEYSLIPQHNPNLFLIRIEENEQEQYTQYIQDVIHYFNQ